jgi:hypothetical protein
MSRSRWLVLGLVLGGAIAAVAGSLPIGGDPPSPSRVTTLDWTSNPIGPGADKGSEVPSSGQLPFKVLLPREDPSVSVEMVWTRADVEPALAVQYASGIYLIESPAEPIDFPTDSYYEELVKDLPGASLIDINGAPAIVIQSSDDLGNPSSVDVILEGVRISIIGSVGQDASELVVLASSIPAEGAGRPLHVEEA